MSRYKIKDGTYVTKSYIDKKIREAKQIVLQKQLDEYGYNFCVKSGSREQLTCSHIISVNDCQRMGRSELAWDTRNIEVLSIREHQKHEVEVKVHNIDPDKFLNKYGRSNS